MKFSPDRGSDISICTPQEVITFRENRGSGKEFNDRQPMSPDVAAKITAIHKVHGFKFEENTIGLLLKADFHLLFDYNFRDGYLFTFGPSVFPDWLQTDTDIKLKIIEYARMILEAYGWNVIFSEDDAWYYLNFAPLLALTPEEVNAEIQQRVNNLAGKALQVINAGHVNRQERFTYDELGLDLEKIDAQDFLAVLDKLTELLDPKWEVTDLRDFTIRVNSKEN